SISLWDLHEIDGLPIIGRFDAEVIPTTESLNRKDQKGVPYVPHICHYLFLAYHKILRDSKGKFGEWVFEDLGKTTESSNLIARTSSVDKVVHHVPTVSELVPFNPCLSKGKMILCTR
ncbi:unnamed protein product, partial [Prunus brigantina]